MTTKRRFHEKYALQVRERDHNLPHVHLVGGGIEASIDLETLNCSGMIPAGLKREVLAWIAEHRDELLEDWTRWHP